MSAVDMNMVDYVQVGTDSQSQCMYRSRVAERFYGRDFDHQESWGWFTLVELLTWYGPKCRVKKICKGKDVWKFYD